MIRNLVKKVIGNKNDRDLKKLQPMVDQINSQEAGFAALTDEQLQAKTVEFRQRLDSGETLEVLLPEAFSVVREASKRVLGLRPFDVQLIGGMVLDAGKIAEMKTGEG
ncbi:MAG: preprotein translocase subunit SecA, partial [Deltaproteobacteria bacterium]